MNAPNTQVATQGGALVASLATEGGSMTVAQIKANRELMKQVMQDLMEPGVHYGKIPGSDKPSLLKPGAELLCVVFRVNAKPTVEDLSTEDCIRYRIHMAGVHIPTAQEIASGLGECSTDEEKYKWRKAHTREEWDETPDDRRRYNFKSGVHQVRTNPADAANTALKMAEKRAKVDLALSFSGASDVFSQDLDDIADWLREKETGEPPGEDLPSGGGKARTRAPERKGTAPGAAAQAGKINDAQLSVLKSQMDHSGVSEKTILEKYGIDRLEALPFAELNGAIQYCRNATPEPK